MDGDQIATIVPLVLWAAALLATGVAVLVGPRPVTFAVVADRLLKFVLIFPLGLQGLWTFLCHVFLPVETAASIGWEPSPFQYEIGVANLGIGIASLYAAFQGFQARAAVAVMAAAFLGGSAVGHLRDIGLGDALTPGNSGPLLYSDILTPIAVLVLLLLTPRAAPRDVKAAEASPVETSLAARIASADKAVREPRKKTSQQPHDRSGEQGLQIARKAVRKYQNALRKLAE